MVFIKFPESNIFPFLILFSSSNKKFIKKQNLRLCIRNIQIKTTHIIKKIGLKMTTNFRTNDKTFPKFYLTFSIELVIFIHRNFYLYEFIIGTC